MLKYVSILVFNLFLLVGCDSSNSHVNGSNIVIIEINDSDHYIIDKKIVQKESFRNSLLNRIKKVENKGYKREEITIDLRAHPKTKMKKVTFVQSVLRDFKIINVLYSNTINNQST